MMTSEEPNLIVRPEILMEVRSITDVLINRTPHDVVLRIGKEDIRISPSGGPLGYDLDSEEVGSIDGPGWRFPLRWVQPHSESLDSIAKRICDEIPDDKLAIVSDSLLDAFDTRSRIQKRAMHSCVALDMSTRMAVRDNTGQIVAVRGLRIRGDAIYGHRLKSNHVFVSIEKLEAIGKSESMDGVSPKESARRGLLKILEMDLERFMKEEATRRSGGSEDESE